MTTQTEKLLNLGLLKNSDYVKIIFVGVDANAGQNWFQELHAINVHDFHAHHFWVRFDVWAFPDFDEYTDHYVPNFILIC